MTEDDVSYAALLEEALEEAIAIKEGRVDPSRTHEALMIPFEIDVEGGLGNTEVRLDGEKVPDLRNVELEHEAGDIPRLTLHVLPGEGTVTGEAEVRFEIGGRTFVEETEADRSTVEREQATP